MINNVASVNTPVYHTKAYALPHAERKDIKEAKIEAKIEAKLPEAILITDNNPSDNNLMNAEIIQSFEASSSKYIKASEESNDEKIIKDILNEFSNGYTHLKKKPNTASYDKIKKASKRFINLKNNYGNKKYDIYNLDDFTENPIEVIFENELKKILYPKVENKSLVGSLISSKKKTIFSTIFENELAGEDCYDTISIPLSNVDEETIENIFCIAKNIYNKVLNQSINLYGGKNKKTKKRRKKQQKTKKKKTKQQKTKKKKTKRFSHNILKKRH